MKRLTLKENWLPLTRVAGYEVSDLGGVRSLIRRVPYGTAGATKRVVGKVIKPFWVSNNDGRQGHLAVELGQRRRVKVHHLVLETFVGPRPLGLIGLHKDDDSNNNSVGNLYWGTYSQNSLDAYRNGRRAG